MDLKNLEAMAQEYKELQRMKEELEGTIDALKDAIKEAMNGAEVVTAGAYKIAHKMVTSTRFDSTRFKKDHAELAAAYTKTTTASRFTIN